MQKFVYRSTKILYALMMAAIFGVLLFYSKGNYFGIYCNFPIRNLSIVAVGVILSAVIYALRYIGPAKHINKAFPYDRWVKVTVICLYIFQLYASYNILIYPGWDAGGTLRDAGIIVYHYRDIYQYLLDSGYSRYPNNLLLLVIDTVLIWINRNFGFFTGEQTQMCIAVFTCLVSSLTCLTVYKAACLYLRKSYAFGAFLVSVIVIGLNPWFSFCYTDSFGVLFPILVVYLYEKPVSQPSRRLWNRLLAMALGAVGYRFKPQCGIMVIALLAMEFVQCFSGQWKQHLKQLCLDILAFALTIGLLAAAIGVFCNRFDIVVDKELSFGPAHFFMMGLNEEREGAYLYEDVEFSGSFATKAQRNAADLERAVERIKAYGPVGLAKHVVRKLERVYDDGTFRWTMNDATSVPYPINKTATPFLRSFYYNNPEGTRYEYFGKMEQFMWVMILVYAFAAVWKRPERMETEVHCVLLLAIVGLILFELLFEANSRYLFTSVPVFILLAATGAQSIGDGIRCRIK